MGGDLLVRGAVALARRARVSPLLVAATVVAFGTSVPELVVALQAALTGYPGIVIGNVVGSNIANVLLVGGAAAVFYPLPTEGGTVRRDSAIMLAVSLLFAAFSLSVPLHRGVALAFLVGLACVWALAARDAQRDRSDEVQIPLDWVLGLPSRTWMILTFIALGAVGLPLGASLIVDSAVTIAETWGVSDAVVGLSVLAVSTSLPELATVVVAAMQKRTDVALGTLIGSNILNILAILGITGLASPVPVPIPSGFVVLHLPTMLLSAAAIVGFVWYRKPIGQRVGVGMVLAYIGYITATFVLG